MPQIPDHIAALRTYLAADPYIAPLVTPAGASSARVFAGEIPREQTKDMPIPTVLIRPAGGLEVHGGGYQQFGDKRIDVYSYGSTPRAANDVWRVVHPALKQLGRELVNGCLLHWANPASGPLALRDPDNDWPFTLSVWQVMAAEVAPA